MIKRILYITNARIPTEKAHGLQIIKMCEALQRSGMEVELMVPSRIQSPAMRKINNLWEYYEVDTPFQLRYLLAPDFVRLGTKLPSKIMTWLYYAQCLVFSLLAVTMTLFRKECLYYSRDLQTIFLLCMTKWIHRKRIYFEAHELHGEPGRMGWRSRLIHLMLQRIDGVIVITQHLKTLYATMGVAGENILVASDCIDKKRLSFSVDKLEARKHLQIPLDKNIICYTGHLFQWKGVYTLAESVQYLPEDCVIYVIGGMDADIIALQGFIAEHHLKNIVLIGYIPYHDVAMYLAAADILVLPNSAKAKIAREYTSPLKLFEYMGAQRPIVASDLPSLREVLCHRKNAYLVQPDDPKALAEGIIAIVDDKGISSAMTKAAYQDVQKYTWDIRAENILTFLN